MSNLIATTILPELTALMGRGPKSDDGGFCDGGTVPPTSHCSTPRRHRCTATASCAATESPRTWSGRAPSRPPGRAATPTWRTRSCTPSSSAFPQDGWCGDYEWLREMTAQWVQDYVTDPAYGIGLGPDDTEFEAVPHFMDAPNTSLDDDEPDRSTRTAPTCSPSGAPTTSARRGSGTSGTTSPGWTRPTRSTRLCRAADSSTSGPTSRSRTGTRVRSSTTSSGTT